MEFERHRRVVRERCRARVAPPVRDRRAPRGDISLVRFRRASSSSRPRAREERPAIDAAKSARGDGATMRARDATRASDAATALRGALRARAVTAVMTMRFASTRAVDAARRHRDRRAAPTRGRGVVVDDGRPTAFRTVCPRVDRPSSAPKSAANFDRARTRRRRGEDRENPTAPSRRAFRAARPHSNAPTIEVRARPRVYAPVPTSRRPARARRTLERARARRTLGQCVRIHRAATRNERRASVVDDGRERRR